MDAKMSNSESPRVCRFTLCPIAPEDNQAVRIKFAHLGKDGVFNKRISTVDFSASARDRGMSDCNLDDFSSHLAAADNIHFEPFHRFWLEERPLFDELNPLEVLDALNPLEERFRMRKHQGNKKRRADDDAAEDDNGDASPAPAVDMEY
ncbi:hypothetical protein DM860_004569 [Cuscuta australis]|uniref:Uncharacterized protein n=1 Tax=Cuscuta australis TaxID=267555 RepID=A0A328EBM9_9ASTE|nr:hypothetical protein DM860_004569 [Cuscuta australis]